MKEQEIREQISAQSKLLREMQQEKFKEEADLAIAARGKRNEKLVGRYYKDVLSRAQNISFCRVDKVNEEGFPESLVFWVDREGKVSKVEFRASMWNLDTEDYVEITKEEFDEIRNKITI